MQATQLMMFGLVFGLIPNFAHAHSISPTIIVLSATLIFLMFLTVYVVYKIRRSLSNPSEKNTD
ncbi:hypothetical protein A3K93_01150 [Acinetobacter sp. NCu2D-2]|uniref:hypothetical protein n=1 Tax=Acinetobacter sp. NCu2D-2 TaxID=1608473 RepID=UPI0007CDCB83|nr:hypothetical protein [Acinetobacter sp. NCu2D-2]ANF80928.1 hypothetical protein A3K93_01150 [Acinetobacter sp. NCu2D-2]